MATAACEGLQGGGDGGGGADRVDEGLDRLEAVAGHVGHDPLVARGRRPAAASLARVAMVTPPAVSAKMPSVRASRRMPSRISSSVTDREGPAAVADRLERVPAVGRVADGEGLGDGVGLAPGGWRRCPRRRPWPPASSPPAWAPDTRTWGSSSSRPTSWSSANPLATLVSWLPDATGTTRGRGPASPAARPPRRRGSSTPRRSRCGR